MSFKKPAVGMVVSYSYLWASEAKKGQKEGLKDRPCVIVIVKGTGNDKIVVVSPITHSASADSENGIEIPCQTKERLGLDDLRSWVVSTEANKFSWSATDPGPDLKPVPKKPGEYVYGLLPPNLMADLRMQIQKNAIAKTFSTVERDDPEHR